MMMINKFSIYAYFFIIYVYVVYVFLEGVSLLGLKYKTHIQILWQINCGIFPSFPLVLDTRSIRAAVADAAPAAGQLK